MIPGAGSAPRDPRVGKVLAVSRRLRRTEEFRASETVSEWEYRETMPVAVNERVRPVGKKSGRSEPRHDFC